MIFLPLETELFYYEHLFDSSDNLRLIQDFVVTNTSGYGLERYIKELAKASFTKANEAFNYEIDFRDYKLNENTALTAKGFDAVCVFVNDVVNAAER